MASDLLSYSCQHLQSVRKENYLWGFEVVLYYVDCKTLEHFFSRALHCRTIPTRIRSPRHRDLCLYF